MVIIRAAALQPPLQDGGKYHHLPINPTTTKPLPPFVTFWEQAAKASLGGGGRLTTLTSWQVRIESSVSPRSHYKTSTLKLRLSSFPRSSVWAVGVSAPVVTANAAWQRSKKLKNPWRVSEGFQRWTSSSAFFFLFFLSPNIVPGIKTSLILFPKLGSYDSFIAVPY